MPLSINFSIISPIKRYNLDRAISTFAVSPNDSMLYSFDEATGFLVQAALE